MLGLGDIVSTDLSVIYDRGTIYSFDKFYSNNILLIITLLRWTVAISAC